MGRERLRWSLTPREDTLEGAAVLTAQGKGQLCSVLLWPPGSWYGLWGQKPGEVLSWPLHHLAWTCPSEPRFPHL